MSYAKLIRALVEIPMTVAELVEETGYYPTTVRAYLKALRKEKLVYITGYHEDKYGRNNTPAFSFGVKKKDAPRTPKCRATRVRAERARDSLAAQLGILNAPGPSSFLPQALDTDQTHTNPVP